MFTELTNELLDLTASVRGKACPILRWSIDCSSSSSCACLFFCH